MIDHMRELRERMFDIRSDLEFIRALNMDASDLETALDRVIEELSERIKNQYNAPE